MAEASESEVSTDKLLARELPSAVNSAELLAEHKKINGTKVRTRFPPEPNGYLHVGHAKSMNMNFELAFEKLGVPKEDRETIFRYDDTNPEAESREYIDSLREDVDWMGWKPVRVTYTSDYFDQLYELAVKLIKNGKAYVCHQSKIEIEASREITRQKIADPTAPGNPNSPWRDRPIEESLREFENMRKGKYDANAATLRLKMDMMSPNPNMWDQVAYRIKYMAHPHAGDKWCIYPTYDYTHCIIDSLEHIDYSICTLEFETRRESYFWVLEALDLYRPKVYEMSRLNISYTVLSKRKLLKLVSSGFLRGWDDPRMPTIKGLRRRGYNAKIMNNFCNEIGVTRNSNVVQYERLAAVARSSLHEDTPRSMVVLHPIPVYLTNYDTLPADYKKPAPDMLIDVPDYPFDPTRSETHKHQVYFDTIVYIDRADFRATVAEKDDYYGLTVGKCVGLKYAYPRVYCDSFETSEDGSIKAIYARILMPEEMPTIKSKTTIQWVAASSPDKHVSLAEVRLYGHLFTLEEPHDDTWEAELNPHSEVIVTTAKASKSLASFFSPEKHVQFERIGFFVADRKDSKAEEGKMIYNLTVTLKDSKPEAEASGGGAGGSAVGASGPGGGASRKEEQARQLAEKMARMTIRPEEMFLPQKDVLYSAFDEEGIPTHDEKGEKISKSMLKKLKKEWEKQKMLYESAQAKK